MPVRRFKAGFTMGVCWRFYDKESVEKRRELGLPSSKIHDTHTGLASKFLFSLSLNSLVILILNWIAGDGCIRYRYDTKEDVSTFKYCYMEIYSRDKIILELFAEALAQHGFTRTLVSESEPKSGAHNMFVWNDAGLNDVILECLGLFNEGDAHPKLKFLRQFLVSHDQCIPLRFHGVKTLSYYQFLGAAIDDPMGCLIGQ